MPTAPPSRPLALETLAEIAVGATARVELCRVLDGGGRLVAVKRFHPELVEDPSFVDRFLDEVRTTAALEHPNVVQIAGWGTDAEGLYLAVELVEGVSLARLLKTVKGTGEAFPERMVVYIGERICRALAVAHSRRGPDGRPVVHRDLALGDVLVGFNGDVKVSDLGLARAKERRAQGVEIDHRADLFSLGVVLYELLAGRHPFGGASEDDALELVDRAPPPDLLERRPKVDKAAVKLVMSCLARDPAARPATAEALRAELDEWLEMRGHNQDNAEALARFVRRNAMRQMRWFERVIAGEPAKEASAPLELREPEPPRSAAKAARAAARDDATSVERRPAAVSPLESTLEDEELDDLASTRGLKMVDNESEDSAPTVALRIPKNSLFGAGASRGARAPARPAPPPPPDPRIRAEAERLGALAARWAEEATAAAARARALAAEAERLAEGARIAAEAAAIATAAVELGAAARAEDAGRELARALEVERALDGLTRAV